MSIFGLFCCGGVRCVGMRQKEMIRQKVVGQSFLKTAPMVQTASFESERFSFYELSPDKGVLLLPENDSFVVVAVFSLADFSNIDIKSGKMQHLIQENTHNLIIVSDLGSLKTHSEGLNNSFYISLSLDFVQQQTGQLLTKAHFPNQLEVLSVENLHVTPEMRSIITELTSCKRKGIIRQLFLESKVLKLVMLQLEQHEMSQKKDLKFIKEYDVEKIHQAKEILDRSISSAVTLIELAHLVGLNDFKLKRGFKEIYNTTVYNYLYEQRMLEAKKMLLNSSISVNEIASNCGYEFVQSFIKAFKRKYGIPPDRFRNLKED